METLRLYSTCTKDHYVLKLEKLLVIVWFIVLQYYMSEMSCLSLSVINLNVLSVNCYCKYCSGGAQLLCTTTTALVLISLPPAAFLLLPLRVLAVSPAAHQIRSESPQPQQPPRLHLKYFDDK